MPLTQYPGRVQVFKQVLAHREPKLVTHAGYEWLYVLAGELRLIIGERTFTLRPGEVAEFDTGEPHWFGPAEGNEVEILHLFGPRGDQAVVRTGPSVRAREVGEDDHVAPVAGPLGEAPAAGDDAELGAR